MISNKELKIMVIKGTQLGRRVDELRENFNRDRKKIIKKNESEPKNHSNGE